MKHFKVYRNFKRRSNTYPRKIQDAKKILDDISRDIDTVQSNTVLDDKGQEKFSIIFNGKTFSDKKEATAFLADLIKKNSSSLYPLRGLSGEFKGLHISTAFQRDFLHAELVLDGFYSSRKNSSSLPGDNINRIIEMANSRTKAAVDKQAEIDFLQDKINTGIAELNSPLYNKFRFKANLQLLMLNYTQGIIDILERERSSSP